MTKYKLLSILAALALLLTALTPAASAQTPEPGVIVWINSPISDDLRAYLDAWLVTPPASAKYYAVTYTQPTSGGGWYVSLVGLNIDHPDDEWFMTGDQFGNGDVIWLDTIHVDAGGGITYPFAPTVQDLNRKIKLALPVAVPLGGAGGGSYVRFPWQPSRAVQFGILGVHDSEYQLGGVAVDLVSGSDMGSGAANDAVYASVAGSISHICDDGTSLAVRLSGNGDQFLYAHLLDNANLELNHSFSSGEVIGRLKHGSFGDTCGTAVQQDDHWHLHWGFLMSGGKFSAEGCSVTGVGPTSKWTCGTNTIRPLGYLTHYGNITSTDPGTLGAHTNPGGAGGGPSFWDYFLGGVFEVANDVFLKSLPSHGANMNQLFTGVITSVKVVMRVAYILVRGNLNLIPAIGMLGIGFTIILALRLLNVTLYLLRVVKGLPFIP